MEGEQIEEGEEQNEEEKECNAEDNITEIVLIITLMGYLQKNTII